VGARPYAQALADVIGDLYSPELAERFPLLRQLGKRGVRRVALLLITSNRGLCGAFNANLIREARRRIEELEGQGAQAELHLVGKKGIGYFKFTRRPITSQRVDIGDRPTAAHAAELVEPLMVQFATGTLDAVDLVFAKFNSAVSTPPTTLRILPVTPPSNRRSGGHEAKAAVEAVRAVNYILKPSAEAILESLLPLYVRNQVYRALVETAAAEHGARRTAMKNATDAGGDMLDILQRTFNRARQGQITQELAEIVGGAEALKG
jgi:F-type H+-transporting ATPase subunit gamma